MAFEADDGRIAGLCVCRDRAALDEALAVAETWRREHGGPGALTLQPLITGAVIAQRGF